MGDVSAAGLPDETGVLVLEDQSGLLSGDVILKINDMPVKSLLELTDSFIKDRNHLELSIWRNQRKMQIIIQSRRSDE
jgi:S1-C subfamily serine protease